MNLPPQVAPARYILDLVAADFGCTKEEVLGRNSGMIINEVRAIAMHLVRVNTPMSTLAIGGFFRRDHSTVISNCAGLRSKLRRRPNRWLKERIASLQYRIVTAGIRPQDINGRLQLATVKMLEPSALSTVERIGI